MQSRTILFAWIGIFLAVITNMSRQNALDTFIHHSFYFICTWAFSYLNILIGKLV